MELFNWFVFCWRQQGLATRSLVFYRVICLHLHSIGHSPQRYYFVEDFLPEYLYSCHKIHTQLVLCNGEGQYISTPQVEERLTTIGGRKNVFTMNGAGYIPILFSACLLACFSTVSFVLLLCICLWFCLSQSLSPSPHSLSLSPSLLSLSLIFEVLFYLPNSLFWTLHAFTHFKHTLLFCHFCVFIAHKAPYRHELFLSLLFRFFFWHYNT